MRKLLITGGAGFIGSNFVHYWKANHPNDLIVVLDKLTYCGSFNNLTGCNVELIRGDINDKDCVSDLFNQYGINTIVNFAAESHVDRSIHNSEVFMQSNVMGTHTLLSIAEHFWNHRWKLAAHRFHHISTDEVFGSLAPEDAPFTESHPYEPNSPYAASKAGADHIVRAFHMTHGLKTTISHCSNNYGPFHFPEKMIPLCLVNILQGKPLPIYGDGLQIRDWLHVTDHCRGIEAILEKGAPGSQYNIGGNEGEIKNIELVNMLCDIVDKLFQERQEYSKEYPLAPPSRGHSSKELIQYVTDRPGHDRRYAINSDKIKRELGLQYRVSLTSGLKETAIWFINNRTWWEALLPEAFVETAAIDC